MRNLRFVSLALIAILASACAGGNVLPRVRSQAPAGAAAFGSRGRVPVALHVEIGRAHRRHRRGRSPKFVSTSTNGLAIAIYPHGAAQTPANLVASENVDVSSGSKACGGQTGFPRTCTANFSLVPTGGGPGYDVALESYDFPPSPIHGFTGANLLGIGSLSNAKVALGKANDFVVYISGVIAGISGMAPAVSLPGDGAPHALGIVIDPQDFGNHQISGGSNDPFANPISVSLTESNGTGHMLLSLNGAPGATHVTVSHSNDSVQVLYDGGGQIDYGATVTLNASAVNGFGGATETVNVSPMIMIASGNYHYQIPPYLTLGGNGDWAIMLAVELNVPAGATFTDTTSHCAAIADTTVVKPSFFGIPGFTVFARPTISQDGSCIIAVSDGMSTVDVQVLNEYNGVLGGAPAINTFAIGSGCDSPVGITVGTDGNMWYGEQCGGTDGALGSIQATGTTPVTYGGYAFPNTNGQIYSDLIAPGPDGDMWATSGNYASGIGKMTTAGSGTTYPNVNNTDPNAIAQGQDGAMWFTEYGSSNSIGRITTDGTITTSGAVNSGSIHLSAITLGSDGNMWFTECSAGIIGKITTGMTVTQFVLPAGSKPDGITAGPDGALWFTDIGKAAIGRIPVTATPGSPQVTLYSGMTGSMPLNITTGPDGALWFTESSDPASGPHNGYSVVGRLDPYSHTTTEYALSWGGAEPFGIASGPDGAIWFTTFTVSGIHRLTFQTSSAIRTRPFSFRRK